MHIYLLKEASPFTITTPFRLMVYKWYFALFHSIILVQEKISK